MARFEAVIILIICYFVVFHVVLPWMDRREAKKETMRHFRQQMAAVDRVRRNAGRR